MSGYQYVGPHDPAAMEAMHNVKAYIRHAEAAAVARDETPERVEVTPELLARWEEGCTDARDHGAFNVAVPPSVVLALVRHIRNLETAYDGQAGYIVELIQARVEDAERIRELESERDAMRLEEDRSGPDAGECGVSLEGAKAGAVLPTRVNIWSGEHRAWWREESRGYVYARRGAGIYTAQGAYQCTAHCGPEKEIAFYPAKYTAP